MSYGVYTCNKHDSYLGHSMTLFACPRCMEEAWELLKERIKLLYLLGKIRN